MRPHGSSMQLYRRRQRAIRLLRQDKILSVVARQVGASAGSVHLWRKSYRLRKEAGIAPKPTPGRPRKLKVAQEQALVQVLRERFDALVAKVAAGGGNLPFSASRLTTLRVSRIIEGVGVIYHLGHVGRVLRRLGWQNTPGVGWYPPGANLRRLKAL